MFDEECLNEKDQNDECMLYSGCELGEPNTHIMNDEFIVNLLNNNQPERLNEKNHIASVGDLICDSLNSAEMR
jgi:hypothetical protein